MVLHVPTGRKGVVAGKGRHDGAVFADGLPHPPWVGVGDGLALRLAQQALGIAIDAGKHAVGAGIGDAMVQGQVRRDMGHQIAALPRARETVGRGRQAGDRLGGSVVNFGGSATRGYDRLED